MPKKSKKHKLSIQQQLHINSFKALHVFARRIKQSIIDRVWSTIKIPDGLNPYNYFLKCNSDAFGKTDHVEFPQLMTLSTGKLLPVENLKVEVGNSRLTMNWTSRLNSPYANANDKLTIAILRNRKNLQIFDTNFIRSEEKDDIELPELNSEMNEGFIFWTSANNKDFSRSDYWCYRK